MNSIQLAAPWAQELMPNGLSVGSSTIISGAGGSGKPLVELAFVAQWLKQGGQAIAFPLQYPSPDFLEESLASLYQLQLKEYTRHHLFVKMNPDLHRIQQTAPYEMEANLLLGEHWDEILRQAEKKYGFEPGNTLVYGSALNLLLFADRYKQAIQHRIKELLTADDAFTYMFSVSTSALREDIRPWEEAADNLWYTEMTADKTLYFYLKRHSTKAVLHKKVSVPIQPNFLKQIKKVADASRNKLIPKLKQLQ